MKSLRDYIALVEAAQQQQPGFLQGLGQSLGNAANAVVNAPGNAVKAVQQGWNDFSKGAEQGYAGKVPAAGQAAQPGKAAAKPAGTPDPKVLALQKALIAKGAVGKDGKPLKADGIMGPNTQFAQQQASGQGAQPAAGSLPPNTVTPGQNPGIDDATRAAAMAAVGGNPAAPAAPAAPGAGQPGPTVAAAQGQDASNPLKPAVQPQATPAQVAQFMAQAKKTPGVGQPAAAPNGLASLNPAQVSGGANNLWEGTDPELARILKLSKHN